MASHKGEKVIINERRMYVFEVFDICHTLQNIFKLTIYEWLQ